MIITQILFHIHTLRVHLDAHAAANLNSGKSKYAKVARMHYFCTVALQTHYASVSVAKGCIHARVELIHLLLK